MLFRTLRRMIERNQVEGLEEKIEFFHNSKDSKGNKKLSDEEYETLMKMLKEKNSKRKSC